MVVTGACVYTAPFTAHPRNPSIKLSNAQGTSFFSHGAVMLPRNRCIGDIPQVPIYAYLDDISNISSRCTKVLISIFRPKTSVFPRSFLLKNHKKQVYKVPPLQKVQFSHNSLEIMFQQVDGRRKLHN